MENIVSLESLFHRSKKRIKDLGEVFTPERYVADMLDLLSKGKRGFWANENNVFFEPCCGHGNIVLAVYKRRLEAIYRKNLAQFSKEASFYAVANALNSLWAIDIDEENIESCRTRVLFLTIQFLKSKLNYESEIDLIKDNEDFFTHVLASIKWQVYENETLSSLSSKEKYIENGSKTKSGKKWVLDFEHHEIDFESTWANFFESCEEKNLVPIDYERSSRFISGLLNKRKKNIHDFKFAEFLFKYKAASFQYEKRIDA